MTRSQAAGSFLGIFQVNIIYFASTNEAVYISQSVYVIQGLKLTISEREKQCQVK